MKSFLYSNGDHFMSQNTPETFGNSPEILDLKLLCCLVKYCPLKFNPLHPNPREMSNKSRMDS